jgi:hypothetical protein
VQTLHEGLYGRDAEQRVLPDRPGGRLIVVDPVRVLERPRRVGQPVGAKEVERAEERRSALAVAKACLADRVCDRVEARLAD